MERKRVFIVSLFGNENNIYPIYYAWERKSQTFHTKIATIIPKTVSLFIFVSLVGTNLASGNVNNSFCNLLPDSAHSFFYFITNTHIFAFILVCND